MPRALTVVLLAVPLLAGCLAGTAPDPVCSVVPHELFTLPIEPDGEGVRTDPRKPWDALVRATPEDGVDLALDDTPGVERTPLDPSGNLSRVRLDADRAGTPDDVHVTWSDGDPCGRRGSETWHLDEPAEGEVASPGQGVHVYTAGFWDNGTLFYTNMESVHESDWPRAGWYSWGGGEPLPVYVYDEDPDDKPPWWTAAVPADVPVAGGTTLWNYYVTIPGFNDALKGLSTTTGHVVRMPPEQAYTRDGYEGHDLYGDALTYYVVITDVVDRPCRTSVGDLCPYVG